MHEPGWLAQYLVPEQAADWDDVLGLATAKKELAAVVARLRHPAAIEAAGGRASPGGVLVWGPPGNGKTTICRALVSELRRSREIAAYAIPAAELTATRFGELGRWLATERDGMVVIYIDEIDSAWARPRDLQPRTGVLAAALAAMDGLDQRARGRVLWVGSSSTQPWALDAALVRSGRLGYWVKVPAPNRRAREAAFERWLARIRTAEPIDVRRAARVVGSGTSYADIEQAIEDAVSIAIAEEGPQSAGVRWSHLRAALARSGRIEDEPPVSDALRVSLHEASHWVVAEAVGVPVEAVTASAREGVVHVAEEIIRTTRTMRDLLAATLAGSEGEEVILGDRLAAGPDLATATSLAIATVDAGGAAWQPIDLNALWRNLAAGDDFYRAVREVLTEERGRARTLVVSHRTEIEALAARLRESGELVAEDIRPARQPMDHER